VHNTQPWSFRLRSGDLELHSDPFRALASIDPRAVRAHVRRDLRLLSSWRSCSCGWGTRCPTRVRHVVLWPTSSNSNQPAAEMARTGESRRLQVGADTDDPRAVTARSPDVSLPVRARATWALNVAQPAPSVHAFPRSTRSAAADHQLRGRAPRLAHRSRSSRLSRPPIRRARSGETRDHLPAVTAMTAIERRSGSGGGRRDCWSSVARSTRSALPRRSWVRRPG
jgi:hypothetical protein